MSRVKEKILCIINNKAFHIAIIAIIIIAIIAVGAWIMIKYNQEGEKEMPFEVSKIELISSTSNENVSDEENTEKAKWNKKISQDNDYYIYIEKNENYKTDEQEVIESVLINNFVIEKESEEFESHIYKPDSTVKDSFFKNSDENIVESIEYIGAPESNVKNLQMSNQGDLIYFRYSNKNIAKYVSNDDEIVDKELLKKAGVDENKLKAKITFDLTINLTSRKSFKTKVVTTVPVQGIVEAGTATEKIIDKNQLIFKRN